MQQHRHVFPGYVGPDSSNGGWWHDVNMKHTKYPTAHDQPILGTREFTPGTRKGKVQVPALSFNEWGEPLTAEDVDANLALYKSPPEYAPLDATAMVQEAAAHLMKTSAKNGVRA